MAEKRIFSRLNRWWRNPDQPGADDPLAPGAEPGGGEAAPDPGFGNDSGSPQQSPRDHYTSDVLPPEVEAAGLEALEAEIENLTRKLEKKQQHLEGLLAQRNELHQQLRAAQDTIAALEAQIKDGESQTEAAASAQLQYLEKSNQHLLAERDAALNRLRELDAKHSQDQSMQETALRERDASLNRRQELESTLTQSQAAHEAALRDRDARVTALEADLAARSRALEEALRAKQELSNRIATLEPDLERARASQQDLVQAREETQRALSLAVETDEARQSAEDRVISLQSNFSTLQAELTHYRTEIEELRRQAAAPPPQPSPAPAPARPESVDLTSELEQVATSSFAAPEPPPAQPGGLAAAQPSITTPPMPEESSEPATFELVSPPEEAAPEPAVPSPVPDLPERKKKLILIAEDDPSIRRLLELTLQKAGLDVITAEDGEDAFQKAITERPDAILTDMMMPRMNGLELTSNLKKTSLTARIPVGFLTAQRELEYYKSALDLGSTLYVTKPFRPDNLVTMVNLLLSGKKKPRGGHKK